VMILGLFAGAGSAADMKFAYVDLQKCIDSSNAGNTAKKELEDMVKAKQVRIDELGKDIEEQKGSFERQAHLLTDEAKKAKQEDVERLIRDYKRLVKDSQDDLQKEESKMTAKVIERIRSVVEKIGSEEGYALIFEKNSAGMLFAAGALDISDKVLEEMNKEPQE